MSRESDHSNKVENTIGGAMLRERPTGKLVTTKRLNELIRGHNGNRQMHRFGHRSLGELSPFDAWIGKIVATGPSDAADYTDERYFVKRQFTLSTTTDDLDSDPINPSDDPPAPLGETVADGYEEAWPATVTNISDTTGAHDLPTDGSFYALVFAQYDENNVRHWCMAPGAATGPTVKIKAAGTGTGNYTGVVCVGPATTVTDFSDWVEGVDCLIKNLIESNSAQAMPVGWFGTGWYAEGHYKGTDADSGLPIYYVETFKLFVCP